MVCTVEIKTNSELLFCDFRHINTLNRNQKKRDVVLIYLVYKYIWDADEKDEFS
jgi:hypothetical protein